MRRDQFYSELSLGMVERVEKPEDLELFRQTKVAKTPKPKKEKETKPTKSEGKPPTPKPDTDEKPPIPYQRLTADIKGHIMRSFMDGDSKGLRR
jgi:hypothetical protein